MLKVVGFIKKSRGNYLLIGQASEGFFISKAALELREDLSPSNIADLASLPEDTVLAKWEFTSAPLIIDYDNLNNLIEGLEIIANATRLGKQSIVECDEETQIRITLKEFKGHVYVELRRYLLRKHGSFTAGGANFTFPPIRVDELLDVFKSIREESLS